jgi:long-subunit acyl-CoA synthetase (AMP-forming)
MRFSGFSELLNHFAAATPDAPALRYAAEEELCTCTFAQLHKLVEARADMLRREEKQAYGILANGSFDCVIEIFASVLSGRRTVLLNENAADEVLCEQVKEAELDALWGDPELCEILEPSLRASAEGGAGRVLFFTSGTTARAKAVVLTDASLMSSAYNGGALLPLAKDDTLLCMLPLDHVFGFVCAFLWATSCGAAVALGRGPRHYFDDCAFFRPTALSAVPMLLGFLLQRRLLNPEMRLVLIGAGDCPPELPLALKALGKRVSFGYGLTETSSGVALSLGDDPYAMTVCPEDRITLGDDGEILISAPTCVMQGYYKDPAATDAVLVNGVLHTGDLGAFDEQGLLHITGRKKEILVFSDGTKIFLPEYERDLAGVLAGRDFAVVDISGSPVLVLNGDESERVDLTIRLASVMKDLPIGRRIKDICFISEPLPRTATGKIKRWELQQKVRTV